jgi:hypothetical protein
LVLEHKADSWKYLRILVNIGITWNLQKIYKNKDKFFLERIFFEQIPDSFQNKKNFIFANQDGKLFFYDFSSNSSNLFFDLKKISNIDERKNKYKFDNIEIYRINDEQFLISSGNFLILFTKQSKGNFQTQWSLKTPYKINNNSIIINKDENYLVFSKSNNSIEARDLLDSSLKWFIEDSPIRSLRFSDYPVLFLKQNDLFAFFSKGKILKINPQNGSIISEKNIAKQINNHSDSYLMNSIFDEKTRFNFQENKILIMNSNQNLIINNENFEINQSLKGNEKFQEVIYFNKKIYGIYKNNFLYIIDENLNQKILNIKFDFTKRNIKEKFLSSFKGRNNEFYDVKPKIFIINKKNHENSKYIMFVGSEKKDILYFDLMREKFIDLK